ncbi:MAG TPA: serine/threonine-protein kinase, partial [Gammaproteobacteria bacterium]
MYKTALIIGAVCIVMFAMLGGVDSLRRFEHVGYDLSVYLSLKRPISDKVVVVAIDEEAIEQYGPWPWSRDILAGAQRRINAAGPKVVAYTVSFEGAHNERGLQIMGEFRDENARLMTNTLMSRFQQAVNRLDSDYVLAANIQNSGRTLLGLPYQHGPALETVPSRLASHTLGGGVDSRFAGQFARLPEMFSLGKIEPVERIYLPTPKIGDAAAGWAAGDDYLKGIDGPRAVPLVLPVGAQKGEIRYLPSLPLRIAGLLEDKGLKDIALESGQGIRVGQRLIPTDNAGRIYPYFYKADDEDRQPFPVYSIKDVLSGKLSNARFRDKAVLIGLTAGRHSEAQATPLGMPMAPVELLAHAVSSLAAGDAYQISNWSYILRYLAVVLIGLYLGLLLPRLGLSTGLAVSALLIVALLNIEVILMLTQSVWAPMMLPVAALLCGHLAIEINRSIYQRIHTYKEALTESNLQLGQALQTQGQLDQAFAKYRQCATKEHVLEALYGLGEDYERKRYFKKAADVFREINGRRRKYRDVEKRIEKNVQLANTVILRKDTNGSSTQTLILSSQGVEKPVLGRYVIEKEIGRGAMGTVYLGRDPKIGRTVAIKTMAFSDEFDEEVANEMKQRFQREANTAGRLKHPNIVTIYDVGEEQGLSYMAMDYLEGEPMSHFIKPDKLLPVETVLEVAAQVAEALHYAHSNNVIHRDIKPENIIYNKQTGTPTVTDFGVAALTNANATRTGIVLGSPSYMSPQQVSGERLDGRSDLYSLGVTVYQLLSGTLPFKAESLSNLMYKIATEKHPDIRKVRDDLPNY